MPRKILQLIVVLVALTAVAAGASELPLAAPAGAAVPPVVAVGTFPGSVGVDLATDETYVADPDTDAVSVVDGATNTVVDTIEVTGSPDGLAVDSATDTVYVSTSAGDLEEIDGATDQVVNQLDGLDAPGAVAVDDETDVVYLSITGSNAVYVINGADLDILVSVTVGNDPGAITVDDATDDAYVAMPLAGVVWEIEPYDGLYATPASDIPVGSDPLGIVADQTRDEIFCTNSESDTVSVISGATSAVVDTISGLGAQPAGASVDSTTGTVYVANEGSDSVSAIAEGTDSVTETLEVDSEPQSLAVDADSGSLYVANAGSVVVTVLSVNTGAVLTDVGGETSPEGVAVDPATDRVYVANSGTLSVIDGANGSVIGTVSGISGAYAVAVDSLTDMIYVTEEEDGVAVVNGATDTLVTTVSTDGSDVFAVGVDDATDTIYAVCEAVGSITVISGATNKVTMSIQSNEFEYPQGIAIDQATDTLYVSNSDSDDVLVFNGSTGDLLTTVNVGSEPYPMAYDPTTNEVFAGNEGTSTVNGIAGNTVSVFNASTDAYVATLTPFGTTPEGIAVDPTSGTVYVTTETAVTAFDESSQLELWQEPTAIGDEDGDAAFDSDSGELWYSRAAGGVSALDGQLPPGAPTAVAAATPGNESASLSWAPPAYDGGTPVESYVISAAPPSGQATTLTVSATQQTATLTGLSDGVTYALSLTADNAVGAGASYADGDVTPAGAPGAPTGVVATAGSGKATVSWVAPPDNGSAITGYTVTPYVGTTAGTPVSAGTATSATLTGLTNGTVYTFVVTATNSVGTGPPSNSSAPATPATTPSAPTIAASESGDQSATVTWTAPAANGSPIISYVVKATPTPGTAVSLAVPASSLSATVGSLVNGTAYSLTVTATNAVGNGAPSSGVSVTPAAPPSAPFAVSATPGNAAATVTWSTPADNGSSITGYTVTPYAGSVAGTAVAAGASATSASVTGLTNGTTYTFVVTANNAVGASVASSPSPPVTPATVPSAPTISSSSAGDGSVSVGWTAPGSGGSPIVSYVVTATPASGGASSVVVPASASSAVISSLVNGTRYSVTVTAVNAIGSGAASSAASLTPAGAPAAPFAVAAVGGNAQVTVSWDAPVANGSAITGYTVTPYAGSVAGTVTGVSASATSATITGLTNGTAYTFVVTATNDVGTSVPSSPSAPVTPATTPGAPSISSSSAGDESVSMTWTAPATAGGSAVEWYVVTATPSAGSPSAAAVPASELTASISGLTNGTSYSVTVTAVNAVGSSSPSASVSLTPAGPPAAPFAVSAVAGDARVTVSWAAPSDNGSAVTGYSVTAFVGSVPGVPVSVPAPSTSTTITGLTNGTAYSFVVTATNVAGTSEPSNASAPVMPATTPGAPAGAKAAAGNGEVTLTWSAPSSNGGSAVTGYEIYQGTKSGGESSKPLTPYLLQAGTTTFTVTGLTNKKKYYFDIRAVNTLGAGAASQVSASPVKTATAVRDLRASPAKQAARLTWRAPAGRAPVLGYEVFLGTMPNGESPRRADARILSPTSTSCVVRGLHAGATYFVIVRVLRRGGLGAASSQVQVKPVST